VPADLVERYCAEGWWNDESLGAVIAAGLGRSEALTFAVHSSMRRWRGTIGEVHADARRFAGWLQDREIGPGDVVVLQLPNWREAAVAFWGAAFVGAVVVPVVHFYGAKELEYIVRVTDPDLVVTPARFGPVDHIAAYADLLGASRAVWGVVGDPLTGALPRSAVGFDSLLDAPELRAPAAVDPDAPALIAFTSGTTREPKGVIHSHRTIGFEVRQLSAQTPTGGTPSVTGAPVGHFIGMLSAFLCSLLRQDPIHLLDVWNPAEVLRLMVEEDISMGGGATYFLISLLDHPDFGDEHLKRMAHVGLGGSPVPLAVTQRAARLGIAVRRSYGSTEHPSITGCVLDEPEEKRLATDGRPLLGVEIRLDDDGQIHSRGPDLFLGYTDPALTASVFDDDGWYRTGDVGQLDTEGYLTITDRISDIIIRGGENISAQEVEEALLQLESIAEVAVVAEPDPRLGERAVAVVRVRDGTSSPTLDEIRAHLERAGLAKQKWPESVRVVADLPRTPSGKVQKFRLRQQLTSGGLDHEVGT
jgi:acyl-CoA synthetase (AMP-forming)/AMP-acid ligase II